MHVVRYQQYTELMNYRQL